MKEFTNRYESIIVQHCFLKYRFLPNFTKKSLFPFKNNNFDGESDKDLLKFEKLFFRKAALLYESPERKPG